MYLYQRVASLPLVSPHGHVPPACSPTRRPLSATRPSCSSARPLRIPHALLSGHSSRTPRHSDPPLSPGTGRESHPSPRRERGWGEGIAVETDRARSGRYSPRISSLPRHAYRLWLTYELYHVFGVRSKLSGRTAQAIYDQVAAKLASPEFRPRPLYERFNIEVLCTTDSATDPLEAHRAIRASGWRGASCPLSARTSCWTCSVRAGASKWPLSAAPAASRWATTVLSSCIGKPAGVFQTDGRRGDRSRCLSHIPTSFRQARPKPSSAALARARADDQDAARFMGHMLMEMARMSIEDAW